MHHLYEAEGERQLSMIAPEEWHQRWIGSSRLNTDRRWQIKKTVSSFNIRNQGHPIVTS
ncbi:DUF2452 domain-containing protein [Prosthecobacter sp.]|uniref:DUF2452 domain-containing protein n=1 Tax=Prosthecobacter sp. TaxID=1965333 RepID=UPI002AB8C42C|nr:DUF2452 domain-containing protein [Prosthecobacter sp.]MDZ4402222.1 DUF2452 domain-containing protein [Prosthecobacter sp.]